MASTALEQIQRPLTRVVNRFAAIGLYRFAKTLRLENTQMGFIDIDSILPIEPVPGCRLRTPFGQHLMLSYLQMDVGAEIPMHHHPHEQAGILLSGKLRLTIGDETRVVQPGSLFIIPPNVPHEATAIDGPATVLDVFSPIREDYAKQMNHYIPTTTNIDDDQH